MYITPAQEPCMWQNTVSLCIVRSKCALIRVTQCGYPNSQVTLLKVLIMQCALRVAGLNGCGSTLRTAIHDLQKIFIPFMLGLSHKP